MGSIQGFIWDRGGCKWSCGCCLSKAMAENPRFRRVGVLSGLGRRSRKGAESSGWKVRPRCAVQADRGWWLLVVATAAKAQGLGVIQGFAFRVQGQGLSIELGFSFRVSGRLRLQIGLLGYWVCWAWFSELRRVLSGFGYWAKVQFFVGLGQKWAGRIWVQVVGLWCIQELGLVIGLNGFQCIGLQGLFG